MEKRNGERVGWVGGWVGGFLWVLVLAVLFIAQGRWVSGWLAVGIFAAAMVLVFVLAPWRHPDTPIWKLMLPHYFLFVAAAGTTVAGFGGLEAARQTWWSWAWMIVLILPLFTVGKRRWRDGGR